MRNVPPRWQSPLESSLEDRERFYRSLVEQTRDFITVIAGNGIILFKNRSHDFASGYGAAELTGCNVFDFIHPDDLGRVRAAFDSAVGGCAGHVVEHRFRHKDGSWRLFESVGHYVHDFPFGPIAIVNSRDVTERKSLEAQLRQVQRLEVLGRMTTTVAHDFKSVLASIVACADRLLECDLPSGLGQSVTHLCRTAQQAQDWMHRLLTFTRQDAGTAPKAVSVDGVVISLTTLLHHLLSPDCSLTLHLAATSPLVTIDEVLLEQVIVNLVVNAREAMPSGGWVTIATSTRRSSSDGDSVVLSVSDTGTGMTDDVRARVFEPFFGTKATRGNSGLGLTTVFSIVRQAGGGVEVESELGVGTTFHVRLPARPADGT